MQNPEKVQQALSRLKERLNGEANPPQAALILGSGLADVAGQMDVRLALDWNEVAGTRACTAPDHEGTLLLGTLGKIDCWVLQGRLHLYEGAEPWEICLGARVLASLGASTLVLTNAAGCLNAHWRGRIMCVRDHLNLTGQSPLTGPNHAPWGPRFPDMGQVYDPGLRELARREALKLGIAMESGVYAGVPGPNMETPAETRMLKILGADAVGMSTVLEAMAAHHMGARVLAFSVLTNTNVPDAMAEIREQDILDRARETCGDLGRLVRAVLARAAESRNAAV